MNPPSAASGQLPETLAIYRSINAVAESFFATYKKELIHTRPWNGLTELRQATFLWIEGDYNRRWRHSHLASLTPAEYELGYRTLAEIADPAA